MYITYRLHVCSSRRESRPCLIPTNHGQSLPDLTGNRQRLSFDALDLNVSL